MLKVRSGAESGVFLAETGQLRKLPCAPWPVVSSLAGWLSVLRRVATEISP